MIFKPRKKPNGFAKTNEISKEINFELIRLKLDEANACRKNGDFRKAIELYEEIVNKKIKNVEALYNLGLIYKELNHFEKSLQFFLKTINLEPKNINSYLMLGNLYCQLKNFDKGILFYEKGLDLNEENEFILNGLGNAYHNKQDFKKAIEIFRKALKINPNNAGILNNLANSYHATFQFEKAILNYYSAINIQPNINQYHTNLSQSLFHSNNYSDGWKEYEYRKKYDDRYKNKIWEGQSLKPGERLLIHAEEGLGDTIQFIRYAIYLKDLGMDFKICVQNKLRTLILETNLKENLLENEDYRIYEFDLYIGLISLPRILKVSQNNVIKKDKYLFTKNKIKEKWKKKFKNERTPVIGINWQGNPQAETLSNFGRSLPLEEFSAISKLFQIKFISLQKGFGSEQLEECSFKKSFVDFQEEFNPINDFLECAAVIENCDLVITTDTCVAHLSGALNKKTWLILKKLPDWRWGINGDKTFWYDSIRILRQHEDFNWENVFEEIKLLILNDTDLN